MFELGKKSPFPTGFYGTDLYYDSLWNPLDLGTQLDQSGLQVHHGASSEGGSADVSTFGFTVANGEATLSPRNPTSPLYGKIGRNTPARSSVALGAPWLSLDGAGPFIYTSDSAAVSTTGDLDIRWWGSGPLTLGSSNLLTKWDAATNQRSWALYSSVDGRLLFAHSSTGADQFIRGSLAPIPAWAGPIALRATLDCDNGAGGHTVAFYYAKDLDGPWLPLGAPQTFAGTTTTFDSNQNIYMNPALKGLKILGYEIRHGIDAVPASSFRFDRAVPGYNRAASSRRTNLFWDGRARGTHALGAQGGTFVRDNGEFVLTKTAAAGTVAYGALRGVAPFMVVNQVHTIRLDYKFSGGIQVVYRPVDSLSGATGQVNITSTLNLIQDGEWHTTSATFTTTSTAPGANSAGFVIQTASTDPAGVEARVRNVIVRNNAWTTEQVGATFDGWDTNTPDRFYYWTTAPYGSPAVEYAGVASTTQFADGQAKMWNLQSGAQTTNRHIVASGEVAEWPMKWGRKGKSTVLTDIAAAGVTRRLGQGEEPVQSPIYRAITGLNNPNLFGYWPMEDGPESTRFGSAIGGQDAWWAGSPSLAANSTFGGSKPIPDIGSSRIRFRTGQVSVNATGLQVRWIMSVSGTTTTFDPIEIYLTGGNLNMVRLRYDQPSGGMTLTGWGEETEGGRPSVPGGGGYTFNANGKDVRMGITLTQSGSNVNWKVIMNEENGTAVEGSGTFTGVTLFSITDVIVNASQADSSAAIGHLTVEKGISSIYDVPGSVLGGYQGESGEARLRRLVAERGVPITIIGSSSYTAPMGPQGDRTWLDIARDVELADGGILHDDPEVLGFKYRTLNSLCDQPAVVIDYEDNLVLPFEPVDDDAMTRNRVTRTRPGGSPYTAIQTTGPMSTLPAPQGVGIYDDSRELNVATDDLSVRMAQWGLHIGAWDDTRYPTLGVDLAHPKFLNDPILTRQLLSLAIGDRLLIKGIPEWLPPFDVDVLVTGINIQVDPWHVYLTWTCIPARPYRTAYFNAGHRYSGAGTTITSSLTTTATAVALTLPAGVTWTSADGQYDIVVNGEVMTVTNVTGGNAMTVVRSVNGVVKTHAAGSAVALASPSFYAR